ncbi:zliS Lysozyme family protein [uncultured Caudovirales phage]|uniref:ZliS Lysozyme family protein n=3 Tax=uncultured Caudovirales phage TaxID=2100421 RepID=A0A6J5MIM1_9CAUD|nr:zliS Lysozyme family protein [uncultured Caudovirales phage]CAB4177783.1 zliS Lysozyme family protein [uncultured Caudovirales phage]CAB4187518.1 zliS Lysozyme family protein [uncultured Caudovirales phage]
MLSEDAFEFVVIRLEGGQKITNNPHDPGGLTKWGISQKAYPRLDIKALSEAQAFKIYEEDYWEPMRCESYSPAVALILFDAAVNQGVGGAIRMAQAVAGTLTDGILGPKTIAAINAMGDLSFVRRFAKARVARYLSIDTEIEEANEKGWMNRIIDVTTEALGVRYDD